MKRFSVLDLGVNEVPLLWSSPLTCSSPMIFKTLSVDISNSSAIISGLIPELYKLRIALLCSKVIGILHHLCLSWNAETEI